MRRLMILALLAAGGCRPPAPVTPDPESPADQPTAAPQPGDETDQDAGDVTGAAAGAPEQVASQPDPAGYESEDVGLELTLRRHVGHGYGCGGKCASNTQGSSTVALVCMKDESALMMDAGELSHVMSYPDGSSTETTAWSQTWKGDCLRQGSAVVFELTRSTNACSRVTQIAGEKKTESCPKTKSKVLIGCKLGDVDVTQETHEAGGVPGVQKSSAWTCRPEPEDADLGGTPSPWIFGDTDCLDTWYVGEPQPETHLKPCP